MRKQGVDSLLGGRQPGEDVFQVSLRVDIECLAVSVGLEKFPGESAHKFPDEQQGYRVVMLFSTD